MNTKMVWAGRILSALVTLPFIMGVVMNLKGGPEIAQGMEHAGIPMSLVPLLLTLEMGLVVLYAIPRTAVVGAILLTGYMGGAILTHLRIGEPVYIQTLLPVLGWLGLWLREPRLRELLPLRRNG